MRQLTASDRGGSRLRRARLLAAGLLCAGAACREATVPNYNSPSLDQLETNPTPNVIATAAQGLLIGSRGQIGTSALTAGILGREVYNLDPSEPRVVNGYLVGPLEPGGFGINFGWSAAYQNIRTARAIIAAVDKVPDGTLPPSQKEAIRGFAKTIEALDFLGQIRIRDEIGMAIEIGDPEGELPPIEGKDAVYAYIVRTLDEATVHLQNAGPAFPFQLSAGFSTTFAPPATPNFATPANFLKFNRAIKARVDVYTGDWSSALASLAESFISPAAPPPAGTTTTPAVLAAGVYHVYSANAGDALNGLFDAQPRAIVAHPSFLDDAQLSPSGAKDLRATSKAVVGTRTLSQQGVSSNVRVTVYTSNTSPIPIIKNEELVLLRAEANLQLGNTAAAIQDLDFIRVNSGGLAPIAGAPTTDELLDELLYNRRYSLFFEYGHRWVDWRRYGKLAELPKALPEHRVFPYVPLPVDECLPRSSQPAGCAQVNGI